MLTQKEQDTFGKLLNKIHKTVVIVPEFIQKKAKRVLEFCRKELVEDGKEWVFPLGWVDFPIKSSSHAENKWFSYDIRVMYEFHWSCEWHSVYHNDSVRSEAAYIKGVASNPFGLANDIRMEISLDK